MIAARTTGTLMQALYGEVKEIANDADLMLPGEKGKIVHPAVYKYFHPPRNKQPEFKPYIIVQLGKEKQELLQPTDESEISFRVVVGIYHNSTEIAEGMDTLVGAMERLEIKLKNIQLLGNVAELQSIEKEISHEQPIPWYEGVINLKYNYYKPVLLPDV